MEVRRSSRERKQTSHFQFENAHMSKSKSIGGDSDNEMDSDKESLDSESGSEHEESTPKVIASRRQTRSPLRSAAKAHQISRQAPSRRSVSFEGDGDIEVPKSAKKVKRVRSSDSYIFDGLFNGQDLNEIVTRWHTEFENNSSPAIVDLINFLLLVAGAPKAWISKSVELEAFESDEIDELITPLIQQLAESDHSDSYPIQIKFSGRIAGIAAKGWSVRKRYSKLWSLIAAKIYTSQDIDDPSAEVGLEALRTIVDLLIAFSSLPLVNIRDAVTEATMVIGQMILELRVTTRKQLEVSNRQRSAEQQRLSIESNGKSKGNARLSAIEKQFARSKKSMEQLDELIQHVFSSIFVHRYKDVHDDIRAHCVRLLGFWMLADPVAMIVDDYLKYVGWLCSDPYCHTRYEAVAVLSNIVELSEFSDSSSLFIERFTDRFVEVAAGDIDADIACLMITVLQKLQKKGFLDSASESVLDQIDIIVFDSGASASSRLQALLFTLDHIQGFDVEDYVVVGKTSKTAAAATILRRKNTAIQLETLCEFAEHHLTDKDFSRVDLLAMACVELPAPRHEMLYQWSVMISLLMKETEGLLASALRPTLCSILLRMMVASVKHLHAIITSNNSNKSIDEVVVRAWEALTEHLQSDLPKLLNRFKDNEDDNLEILTQLLPYYDSASNSVSSKSFKQCMQCVADVFAMTSTEPVLKQLSLAYKSWMTANACIPANLKILHETAHSLLDAQFHRMQSSLASCASLLSKAAASTSTASSSLVDNSKEKSSSSASARSAAARRKSSDSDQAKELQEALCSLSSAVRKYKVLWSNLDCRPYQRVEGNLAAKLLADIASSTLQVYNKFSSAYSFVEKECLSIARDCAATMNAIMMWYTHDVYSVARQQLHREQAERSELLRKRKLSASSSSSSSSSVVDEEEREKEAQQMSPSKRSKKVSEVAVASASAVANSAVTTDVSQSINRVVEIRNILLQTLCNFVDFGDNLRSYVDVDELEATTAAAVGNSNSNGNGNSNRQQQLSASIHDIHRVLQRQAFMLISSIRALYPPRESDCLVVAPLAYTPTSEVLTKLRKVFETEGNRIKHAINVIESETISQEEHDTITTSECNKLNTLLVETLLNPLSSSMLFDIEHLNRRQAASIICHLLEPSEIVQDAIKAVMHKLKESDPIKYLEVQMVTLKGMFLDKVVSCIKRAKELEELLTEKQLALANSNSNGKLKQQQQRKRKSTSKSSSDNEEESDDQQQQQQHQKQEIKQVERQLKEVLESITQGYETMELLAVRLSRSMGIAKFKGAQLEALQNFFTTFFDLAFSDDMNMGVVMVLDPYIRFLSPEAVDAVREALESKIAEDKELHRVIATGKDLGFELNLLKLLLNKLAKPANASKGRKQKSRKAAGEADNDDYDYEDEFEGHRPTTTATATASTATISRGERSDHRRVSGSSAALSMGLELENDDFEKEGEEVDQEAHSRSNGKASSYRLSSSGTKPAAAVATSASSSSSKPATATAAATAGVGASGAKGASAKKGQLEAEDDGEDIFSQVAKSGRRKLFR